MRSTFFVPSMSGGYCGARLRAVHLTIILALSLRPPGVFAQEHAHTANTASSLGTVRFPISCSKAAQEEFNTAVALLHHMTYPKAREAFEHVAVTDPKCAMAHWGIAMTLFQPLWPTRPNAKALQRGWDEVQIAKSLQPGTERERDFIAAAEAFFLEPASTDYWLRIRRFEEAMAILHQRNPADVEGDAFYALSLLATAPANAISRSHADSAAALLLQVYQRNPKHPGAMHYLVHANDVPGREHSQLNVTATYAAVAPRNPHALHMPTHIYTRLGDWQRVIGGNIKAAEAALETPAGEHGEYVWDEYPHAIEYLVYAYLQRGMDDSAAAVTKTLRATPNVEPTFKTAFHLASTQARYVLERRAWGEAAMIDPRAPSTIEWDRFPWAEGIGQFARGMGAVHLGGHAGADSIVRRLAYLEEKMRTGGEELFARNIAMLRLELSAWRAQNAQQPDSSRALMQQAVELEVSTPKHAVTPGPTIPALEQLGDLLMEQKRPADALAAYRRSLASYPNRFNSLLGAARAAVAVGDVKGARSYYRQLTDVAAADSKRDGVEEARALLASRK